MSDVANNKEDRGMFGQRDNTYYPQLPVSDESSSRQSASEDDGPAPKRARASKPKVKSGCITCKTRRVKCDETKPFCLRCQKFGRTCDGYPQHLPRPRGLIRLQPRIPSVSIHSPSVSIHTTEEESRYFQHFLERTAYELSGFLDPSFWTRLVLQESHNNAAIRYAVIALGALNKSLETAPAPGLKVNVIQSIDKVHHEQAVLQHLKAIQALNHYISSSSAPQIRNALIACLLFVCFETFQGCYASSVQQTYGGLKILRSYYRGKPGSRPWIPQKQTHYESEKTKKKAAAYTKVLKNRAGCESIHKEQAIAVHVEDYLEHEGVLEAEIENNEHGVTRLKWESSPVPAFDPGSEHIQIPSMGGTKASQEQQERTMHVYSLNAQRLEPSTSMRTGSTSSESSWNPEGRRHSSIVSNTSVSTPQTSASSSTEPQNPSALSTSTKLQPINNGFNNLTTINENSKRPLATRSPSIAPILQNDLTIETILIQSFVRLDGPGLFFGMLPGIPHLLWDIHKTWNIPVPTSFPDFQSAQLCWDFLMDRTMQFYRRTLFNRAYAPGIADEHDVIVRKHREALRELGQFETAFRPILDAAISPSGEVLNPRALVLSLYQKCVLITLAPILHDSEMAYDTYLPVFQYIISTCSLLLSNQNTTGMPKNPRFSFDIGIVPPLHVVMTKCRDPKVRREAIALLFSSPRQEGMWDGILGARIGMWLMACEEKGLESLPLDEDHTNQLPPPSYSEHTSVRKMSYTDQAQSDEITILTKGKSTKGKSKHHKETSYPSPPHEVPNTRGLRDFDQDGLVASVGMTPQVYRETLPVRPAIMAGNEVEKVMERNVKAEMGIKDNWVVPERNRVQLMVVDFHIPDRYIKVKCQRALRGLDGKSEQMDTLIAW